MLKTTLLAASLVASSAAVSQEASAQQMAHKYMQQMKKFAHHDGVKFATASKSLSTSAKSLSKSASLKSSTLKSSSGITQQSKTAARVRTLRGKAGKGKGKDDDKEEEEEEDTEDEVVATPQSYLQTQVGFCAGADIGDGVPLTDDMYIIVMGFALNSCVDAINSDGISFSSSYSATSEPPAVTSNFFYSHGCIQDNFAMSVDVTEEFTFGGALTAATGMCTDTGYGFSAALSLTDTPNMLMDSPSIMFSGSGSVNSCMAGGMDFYFTEATAFYAFGAWQGVCFNGEDENGDADGTSMNYDTSMCGSETSSLAISYFSDAECTIPDESPEVEYASMCLMDWELFYEDLMESTTNPELEGDTVDFVYETLACSNGVAGAV